MNITLLLTGGTIDKKYNELTGEVDFGQSHVKNMLKQSRNKTNIAVTELMLIDSLDMEREHRQKILEACMADSSDRIIITHGTDTMPETAEHLGESIADKTIVLFGAMVPYSSGNSDALFNFGGAMVAVQTLGNGVYVVMNGQVFAWDNVVKNKVIGEFQQKQV